MNEDFALVMPVAVVWAVLAVVYALAPWGDMIGYAWVWGFGSALFLGLSALLLRRQRPQRADTASAER
ncbi:MAG: hypothetical protein WA210_06125 [Burkholderiaceae bacterium]